MQVILTPAEMRFSAYVGMSRMLESIVSGRRPSYAEKFPGEMWAWHIQGAMAEMAFAKIHNVYWDASINKFSSPDVGDVQIRWSMSDRLKVRENERGVVAKMTGMTPQFRFVGWIKGEEAQIEKWKSDPGARGRPAFFVPDGELIRPELLEVRDGGRGTQEGGVA